MGHTWADLLKFMSRTVHPHIRGAYSICGRRPAQSAGSSPHTWGIRCDAGQTSARSRFIPTYVGHTTATATAPLLPAVHPHIRGAYADHRIGVAIVDGSSPHTWGIHLREWKTCRTSRFIPTYVGHTHGWWIQNGSNCGSSPHTWGIPGQAFHALGQNRFIPTYVGHTKIRRPGVRVESVHPHIRGAYG